MVGDLSKHATPTSDIPNFVDCFRSKRFYAGSGHIGFGDAGSPTPWDGDVADTLKVRLCPCFPPNFVELVHTAWA